MLDTVNERFALDVPKAALKDARKLRQGLADAVDKTWASGVHKFYGTPYSA